MLYLPGFPANANLNDAAKISFLIVAILGLNQPISSQAQARNNTSKPNSPIAQPGDIFLGDWQWSDGGEVFHITLERNPTYNFPEFPNLPPRNVVIGQFIYTRNGVVVDQSLTTGRTPFAAFGSPANNRSIEMQFYESGTKGWGALTLTFQPDNPDVLNWTLRPVETSYQNPADRPAVPFLMPRVMTLTRQ